MFTGLTGVVRPVMAQASKMSAVPVLMNVQVRQISFSPCQNKKTRNAQKKHRHAIRLRELYQGTTHKGLYSKMSLAVFARLPRPQVIESESIDYFMEAPQLDFPQTKKQVKLAALANKRAY